MCPSTAETSRNHLGPMINWSSDLSDLLLGIPDRSSTIPVFTHRSVKRGQRLIHGGQEFESLYLVNAGWFKSVYVDESGNEQVMGFAARGDLLGADGIGAGYYLNEVVALGVGDVLVVPFASRGDFSSLRPGLETSLLQLISRQLVHDQLAMMAINTMTAPARIARFLLAQGDRSASVGCSANCFELAMSRQEIASYLGMTIETVSRTLTKFSQRDLIQVAQRQIDILDHAGLQGLASPDSASTGSDIPG